MFLKEHFKNKIHDTLKILMFLKEHTYFIFSTSQNYTYTPNRKGTNNIADHTTNYYYACRQSSMPNF
jgi:hypothetical protein